MNINDLISSLQSRKATALTERAALTEKLAELRGNGEAADSAEAVAIREAKAKLDGDIAGYDARVADLEAEKAADEAATRAQSTVTPTNVRKPAYDEVARVGAEKRTYNPDSDKRGGNFLQDVGAAALGNWDARERLNRHSTEERVERGTDYTERAAGTGAFAGLVVPQYLTELYAPSAKANRPFADVCNQHDLPASGMTVNLSRITTGTSAAVQTENAAASETNIDDTLLTINVQTNAGQQTLSRQAIERGTGVEGAMLDDLFRAYATTLDSTLLNQATNGLTNVATSIAYTDASPTVAELYPKFLQGLAAVEAALLDQDPGDNIAVMHSRRWYWLQNALGSSWPLMQQPGVGIQQSMVNYASAYGTGYRGFLPNGTPVVVDNNVGTTLGAGTEDEIYICSRRESHLWEDPNAPMLIRAEQPAAASLGVLFVVYGYFAYTHARYTQAQKIAGTGLIAPSFTGV
jgi:HK97 family phage major capsid protein